MSTTDDELLRLTDDLLDHLEHLLLSGVRRLPALGHERVLLARVQTLTSAVDPYPERTALAHEWVLARQEKLFPRRRRRPRKAS